MDVDPDDIKWIISEKHRIHRVLTRWIASLNLKDKKLSCGVLKVLSDEKERGGGGGGEP